MKKRNPIASHTTITSRPSARRLIVAKETVRCLSIAELEAVQGGAISRTFLCTAINCPSVVADC